MGKTVAMAVVAKTRGVYGGAVREPEERFNIQSEDDLGSWMSPIGWEPSPKERTKPTTAAITALALEAEITGLKAKSDKLESDVKELRERLEETEISYDDERNRANVLVQEVAQSKAVFDAIRAELVKVVGLPADLKLAEAVAWMADRLSATNATGAAESKAKPNSKKE